MDGQGLRSPAYVRIDSFTAKAHGHVPDGAVVVPDPNLIFHGEFRRAGVDLVLSNDGHEFVVHDYFKGDKRAAIASPDGAHLTGDVVSALTGHVQYAQAAPGAASAEVIGHVTKLAGSATAVRNGVSIILNNGDNVEKGDVVSTGADSTLGITFIDGTVFGLSSNARMVLNEMVYDPNGSNNSSLLSLVAGTITFVAGETAKHGDMKIDTPVATMGIRGTAVLTQINFIVPPGGGDPQPQANFQVLVEPNGTTGSYILFDKITLLPIATVNQAGQMIQISGGNVSVSNALLSPDVQKLITDVFTLKFTDTNSNTKLTTNFTDTITQTSDGLVIKTAAGVVAIPTFVNLNQLGPTPQAPADRTTSNDRIPGPPDARSLNLDGNVQTAFVLTERADKTGDAADLDTVSGRITFLDFNRGDQPTVQVDLANAPNYVYRSAGQQDVTATLTALQQQDIAATQIKIAVVPDAGNHNNGSAVWTYTIPDKAFDFLAAGETLTLTYIVRVDNNFAANNETTYIPITITITGTNDKPTIATSGGTVIEQIGTGNTVLDTITGTVTFTDVDLTDRPIVSAAISSTQPFKYLDAQGHDVTATLTPEQLAAIAAVEVPLTVVQAAGNANNGTATWTYSVADHFFDFLADGETLVLNYVVQVDDGHGGVVSTPVTVSINGADVNIEGTNDVPTIVGPSTIVTGAVTEDTAATLAANGTITFRDPDLTDTHTASFVLKSSDAHANLPGYSETAPLGEIGTFALTAVTEHPGVSTIGSVGWSFALDDSNPVLQSLAEGQTITQVYTVTVDDHHGGTVSQDVTVTITGTNDVPTITSGAAAATGKVTEDTGLTLSIDGTLAIQDLDLIDTHTAQAVFKSSSVSAALPGFGSSSHIGTFTIDQSVTELNTDTDNIASLGWHFTLDDSNPVLQSLAEGQSITQVYTITFTDDHNASVTQDVTVTIDGVNDAPTIASDATAAKGEVTEDTGATLSISGTLAIQDLDLIDTHTAQTVFKSSSVSAALPGFGSSSHIGTFTIDQSVTELNTDIDNIASLGWHFTLDDGNPVLQSLAQGQSITQVYTVTVTDNHGASVSQDITVTINGANDAPTLDNATLPSVAGNESDPGGETIGVLFASKFHDVDNGASLKAIAVTSDLATSEQGVWQYEVGGQWVDIVSVDDAHALVLSPDTLIRFVPADGYTGTPGALGVHALDDSYTGAVTTPATLDLTTTGTGGTTPVSHDVTTISTEVTAPAGGPVINTESVHIWHSNETPTITETITDLLIVDNDAGASTDTFTVTLSTAYAGSSASLYPTNGTLDAIKLAIENGVTYGSGDPAPDNDQITLTVTDTTTAQSDTVHFIFNEAGDTSKGVTLQGTDGKDVIFATESSDTLTGGGGKDQFVFGPTSLGDPVVHTITDFTAGQDKIDLRQFDQISSWTQVVAEPQGTDTLLTVDDHDKILLKNTVASSLKASDFIIHVP
ncbi:VCBS domain-containing protein [Bradyrhizobium sp. CB1650]|uniref:VCBS domain-containing protein n=1 Tax=Bradyrhizobium sp. CB1650 TaxID=3039153 RepID=UPI002434B230|nr:VCBS domain-containing protein [Bradyrhizobium sp. CB1650]WGD52022.1 VCBS domain-containing protein [Bradyrhizobium sp. CB1650]